MKNKTGNLVIYIVGATLFVGLIALLIVSRANNGNDNSLTYSASALIAVDNNFDFQTISMKDGEVSHKFEIRNEGTEPVLIDKVFTSCMCTTALVIDGNGKEYGLFGMPGHAPSKANIEIGGGETAVIKAVFDPAAHGPSGVGLAERNIYLETNSQTSPKVELKFRANVTR